MHPLSLVCPFQPVFEPVSIRPLPPAIDHQRAQVPAHEIQDGHRHESSHPTVTHLDKISPTLTEEGDLWWKLLLQRGVVEQLLDEVDVAQQHPVEGELTRRNLRSCSRKK